MANPLFPVDLDSSLILRGVGKRKNDSDRLVTKAFLIGQQAGALERERVEFLKEQQRALIQNQQMMAFLLSLMQKVQSGGGGAPIGGNPPGVSPGMSGAEGNIPGMMPGGTGGPRGGGLGAPPMQGMLPSAPLPPDAGMGGAPAGPF